MPDVERRLQMVDHTFPRVVAFGGDAGLRRTLSGVAGALRQSGANDIRERLTAVVGVTEPSIDGRTTAWPLANFLSRPSSATVDGAALEVAIDDEGPRRRLRVAARTRPAPELLMRIVNADVIVVGPGSLYASLLPTLLLGGVAATISGINAVRIYVANLLTEPGETDGFTVADYVDAIREHTGLQLFDYVLVNRRPLGPALGTCRDRSAVRLDAASCDEIGVETVEWDLATVDGHGSVRHDATSLGRAILELARRGRPRVPAETGPEGRQKVPSTATTPTPFRPVQISNDGKSERSSNLRDAIGGAAARGASAADLPVEITRGGALRPRRHL